MPNLVVTLPTLQAGKSDESQQPEPTPLAVVVAVCALLRALGVSVSLLRLREGGRESCDRKCEAGSE
jgi:hypothetical protein